MTAGETRRAAAPTGPGCRSATRGGLQAPATFPKPRPGAVPALQHLGAYSPSKNYPRQILPNKILPKK